MSLTADDRARRRAAKAANEQLKLTATVLNNSAIAVLTVGFVTPALRGESIDWFHLPLWIIGAIALHCWARVSLGFYKSED